MLLKETQPTNMATEMFYLVGIVEKDVLSCAMVTVIAYFRIKTAVEDPGFPVGGTNLVGGANSRHGRVLSFFYVKTKELGPLPGGGRWGHVPDVPPDPPLNCIQIL